MKCGKCNSDTYRLQKIAGWTFAYCAKCATVALLCYPYKISLWGKIKKYLAYLYLRHAFAFNGNKGGLWMHFKYWLKWHNPFIHKPPKSLKEQVAEVIYEGLKKMNSGSRI